MKYYIIAGEASGDLHGSRLIRELAARDPQADFRIWGGDLMEAAGGTLVKHYRDLAFMGFAEVVMNLRTILGNMRFCKQDILDYEPDVLILIDYPGFNLRIAKWARRQGLRTFYYISPQIWAWHSSRVHQIRRDVDRMYVILPFEQDFYARYDMEVDYVGHPLLDAVQDFEPDPGFRSANGLDDRPVVALLPGSRRQEIERMLPLMLAAAGRFPSCQFCVAGAPSQPASFYEPFLAAAPDGITVRLIRNRTYDLLATARAGLVTSGTATLEAALFDLPLAVCYRGNFISYWIARRLVEIKYISLVNLIADEPLVKELIQSDCTAETMENELARLLDPAVGEKMQKKFSALRKQLGQGGAAARTAEQMLSRLRG